MKKKGNKGSDYLKGYLPFLMMSGMLESSLMGEPFKKVDLKDYYCKKCGKLFVPKSENKKIYCSVECFKTRRIK